MASVIEKTIRAAVTPAIGAVASLNRRKLAEPASNPLLSGIHTPMTEERTLTDLLVTGTIPAELDGRYVRIGPNPFGVGGSYRPWKWTTFSAGAWYETSAQPSQYFALDFPHPNRVFLTAGVTGHLGPVDVIAGFVYTPTITYNISDSEQRQGQTTAGLMGGIVGDGQYTVGGFIVSVGVRGRFEFGGAKAEAPKTEAPKSEPVTPPATEPAPSPAPTPAS
jgi:hypothetical protein